MKKIRKSPTTPRYGMIALVAPMDDFRHYRVDCYSTAGNYRGGTIWLATGPMTKKQAQVEAREIRVYWERLEREEKNRRTRKD